VDERFSSVVDLIDSVLLTIDRDRMRTAHAPRLQKIL